MTDEETGPEDRKDAEDHKEFIRFVASKLLDMMEIDDELWVYTNIMKEIEEALKERLDNRQALMVFNPTYDDTEDIAILKSFQASINLVETRLEAFGKIQKARKAKKENDDLVKKIFG